MGSGEVGRKRSHSRVSGGLELVLLAQVWGESGHRVLGLRCKPGSGLQGLQMFREREWS